MSQETRGCRNCEADFIIEPDDFAFYEKIKVPPPTFCPQCRLIRRMSFRNFWHLYKKQDAHTGQEIFSAFPPESPVKIYEKEYWSSDAWDPLDYGRDIDWSRPFLSQVAELLREVPLPAHSVQSLVNCEYCTNASYAKNCYYSRGLSHTEDCAYVIWDEASKQCMDSHMTDRCEFGYENVNCTRCYKTFFCVDSEDCSDVVLSKDCVGCTNCVGCVGLRKKSYHIFNVPYGKDEYFEKLKEFDLGSRRSFEECRQRAYKLWRGFPVKFMNGLQNSGVSGDYIYNSKNARSCWRVKGVEDSKYCMNILVGPVRDCYDYANWGAGSELLYEALVCGDQTSNIKFSWNCFGGAKNIEYSMFCHGATDMFGCIGARRKHYCILNKQYSKEEYDQLVPRIIEHMKTMPYVDARGIAYGYGEFFPTEFSPMPFNITEAHELFPKTKEEAVAAGFAWREEPVREHPEAKEIGAFPDRIADTDKGILREVIACAHRGSCQEECTGAFRIIDRELEFLQRFDLPLPSLCPNCRHYGRLAHRNTPRFFPRRCQCEGRMAAGDAYENAAVHAHGSDTCPASFESSYPPERPEIVYCESCYQAEVA